MSVHARYLIHGGFGEEPTELICFEKRKQVAMDVAQAYLRAGGYSVVEVFDSMRRKGKTAVVFRATVRDGAGEPA